MNTSSNVSTASSAEITKAATSVLNTPDPENTIAANQQQNYQRQKAIDYLRTYIRNVHDSVRDAVRDLDPRPEEVEITVSMNENGIPCSFSDVQINRASFMIPITYDEDTEEEFRAKEAALNTPKQKKNK